MRTSIAIVFVLLTGGFSMAEDSQGLLPLPESLISLDSSEGESRFEGASGKRTCLKLMTYFEAQENLAFCGPASASCVLNAAEVPRPISRDHGKYRLFTQANFFNPAVENIVPSSVVKRMGMTLQQLGDSLEVHGVTVQTVHAADSDLDSFRQQAVHMLESGKGFVVINYLRSAIGQQSGGHISPIGAYHEATDSFLILDVSKYKYPPVWVSAEDLWRAMSEKVDSASGKSRGYVFVMP